MLLVSSAYTVFAAMADIKFPVAELGNCADKESCMMYCDEEENQIQCQAFAEKHGLDDRSEKIKELQKSGGPGRCASDSTNPEESCRKFCGQEQNITTCVDWAEENGFLQGRELEEAKQVRDALKRGVKLPPECRDMRSCERICKNPSTAEDAKACFRFAKEAGFAPEETSEENIDKMFSAIKSGKSPFKSFGDFRKCEEPEDDAVLEQCVNFAVENGLLPPEEAEILKKTGGRGPGGCRGRECQNFCNDGVNAEVCHKFAEEHGLISSEDKARMEEGRMRFKQGLQNAPEEVRTCLQSVLGESDLSKLVSGEKIPTQSLGRQMQQCFGQFGGQGQSGGFGEQRGPQNFEGNYQNSANNAINKPPCSSPEECKAFFEQKLNEKQADMNEMKERMMREQMYNSEHSLQEMPEQTPSGMPSGMPAEMSPEMRQRMMEQYQQNQQFNNYQNYQPPQNMEGQYNMPSTGTIN